MSLYQPDFDVDFRRGKVGEDLVGTFLEQLAGSTIEVKTDYRADMTGNVYVETWQHCVRCGLATIFGHEACKSFNAEDDS